MTLSLERERGAAAIETAIVMLPYLFMFTSFIVVAQWLTSIGSVTMEAMNVNMGALAAYNQNGGQAGNAWGWQWQNLFINHPNIFHRDEARNYAQSQIGFTPGDLYKEACMNYAAGVAARTTSAFGFTPTAYGYKQIGLKFAVGWVGVERRAIRNMTLRAETVDLTNYIVL